MTNSDYFTLIVTFEWLQNNEGLIVSLVTNWQLAVLAADGHLTHPVLHDRYLSILCAAPCRPRITISYITTIRDDNTTPTFNSKIVDKSFQIWHGQCRTVRRHVYVEKIPCSKYLLFFLVASPRV